MAKNVNSMNFRIIALIIGLIIDAYANSLTILGNYGNGIWTAATINITKTFGISISLSMFIFGLIGIIINTILVRDLNWIKTIGGVGYMFFFSSLVDLFTQFNVKIGLGTQGPLIRLLFMLIGTLFIGVSISIYQRCNLIMHPNDENTNILRFKFFKGSAIKSQIFNMSILVILVIAFSTYLHDFKVIGFGTIWAIIILGPAIEISDKYFMPKLKHNQKI